MRKPNKPNVPKDAPFDSFVPRWCQWTEDVHIALVRPGTAKAFTEACRKMGVRNYIAFEKMVEFMVATGKLPSLPSSPEPQPRPPTRDSMLYVP